MKTITLLLLTLLPLWATAQLQGTVTSTGGEPLPFASIYVQGTSRGVTTNEQGRYTFDLPAGDFKIVYQYVGYQQKIITVTIAKQPLTKDVSLENESFNLVEVVVRANAEDPAYPIIRKAIAKRKYYKKLVNAYQCDVYIKGNQKLLKAPKKILGQEIGDLGGILDTNGQGIIYLSESQAKLYREQPDKIKEEMFSSKVSGNDNGFGFNRASLMDFSFYDSHIKIEREILSPIANSAFQYYRYKLVGTFMDENGYLINKIEVLKKRESDPVFSGFIYIVEDLWNIQSTELIVTGDAIKQPGLDTLKITQVHVPIEKPDTWLLLSQSLDFTFGFMGFQVGGNFTGVFSNYETNIDFPDKFFSQEIFKVEEGANDKDLTYWDSIRPIPITQEEQLDYVKKDSLQIIWKSKSFLDSIDAKTNKFKIINLLTGYSWQNSYGKRSLSVASPLSTILFNPVQGWYGNLDIKYDQWFDDYSMKWLRINPRLQYGFGDNRLRGALDFTYNFNRTKFTKLTLSGGSLTRQFNGSDPISPFLNSTWAVFSHRNYIHLYQKEFGKIILQHELVNGLLFRGKLEYEDRSYLNNTSNYSFFNKDAVYRNNNDIINSTIDPRPQPARHQALGLEANFRIRLKQKYLSYPNRKYIVGSNKPDVWVHYRKGIKALGSDVNFDQLWINFWDEITFGLVGESFLNLEVGTFLQKDNLRFIDYQHFNGNQVFLGNPTNYMSSFMLLPYYERSTAGSWFQGHYSHNFQGYILDKIPGIRNLNWKLVAGAKFLYTEDQKDYAEIHLGFDNIGFGVFRLFRFDVVASWDQGKHRDTGFMIGLNLPVN